MSTASEPQSCPQCRHPSERTLAAPHFRGGDAELCYKAEAFNERSANEPKVVRHVGRKNADKERGGHAQHSHHGSHSHPDKSNRPWMVGH